MENFEDFLPRLEYHDDDDESMRKFIDKINKGIEFLRLATVSYIEAVKYLATYGWIIHPNFAIVGILEAGIIAREDEKLQELDNWFINYYHHEDDGYEFKEIKDNLLKSNTIDKAFKGKIKNCIEAYENAKYDLAICTLFPIIEGTKNDLFKSDSNYEFLSNSFKQLTSNIQLNVNNVSLFSICLVYFNIIWYNNRRPASIDSKTKCNRNFIMHGHYRDYDTQANALRLLILLDALLLQFENIKDQKDK